MKFNIVFVVLFLSLSVNSFAVDGGESGTKESEKRKKMKEDVYNRDAMFDAGRVLKSYETSYGEGVATSGDVFGSSKKYKGEVSMDRAYADFVVRNFRKIKDISVSPSFAETKRQESRNQIHKTKLPYVLKDMYLKLIDDTFDSMKENFKSEEQIKLDKIKIEELKKKGEERAFAEASKDYSISYVSDEDKYKKRADFDSSLENLVKGSLTSENLTGLPLDMWKIRKVLKDGDVESFKVENLKAFDKYMEELSPTIPFLLGSDVSELYNKKDIVMDAEIPISLKLMSGVDGGFVDAAGNKVIMKDSVASAGRGTSGLLSPTYNIIAYLKEITFSGSKYYIDVTPLGVCVNGGCFNVPAGAKKERVKKEVFKTAEELSKFEFDDRYSPWTPPETGVKGSEGDKKIKEAFIKSYYTMFHGLNDSSMDEESYKKKLLDLDRVILVVRDECDSCSSEYHSIYSKLREIYNLSSNDTHRKLIKEYVATRF